MEEYYLKDLTYEDNTKLRDSEYIDIVDSQIRLFYKTRESKNGFDFYVVLFMGLVCNDKNTAENDFDSPDVCVECVYNGIAYYDGLRHFYMGHKDTGNENYLYYPDPEHHILIFKALEDLIKKHCNELAL
jgi:hypothetical protein